MSWNFKKFIIEALKLINLDKYFRWKNIFDRTDVEKFGGYSIGKGNLIEFLSQNNKSPLNKFVLIDDSSEVLGNAKCKKIQVTSTHGMDENEIK